MAGGRFRTRDVLVPGGPADFGSLLLSAPVLAGLEAAGFHRPSPVQLKAIPLGRCGLGERAGRARGRGQPGGSLGPAVTSVAALSRSHRAGQVWHRQNLRVLHRRPGRGAAGEPRHAGEPRPRAAAARPRLRGCGGSLALRGGIAPFLGETTLSPGRRGDSDSVLGFNLQLSGLILGLYRF